MNINELNRILDESPRITGVSLMVDQYYAAVLYKKLKAIPMILGLNIVSIIRQIFEDIMAENLLKMVLEQQGKDSRLDMTGW